MKTCKRDELPEGFQVFEMENGRKYAARRQSCVFCRNCAGILYDWGGPYAFICEQAQDTVLGMQGICKQFAEADDEQT